MVKLNNIEKFQLFCLENYKTFINISGEKALHDFESNKVFDFLAQGYEVMHTQSAKYIVDEIIVFIKNNR